MFSNNEITWIVPCRNEAETIGAVVDSIKTHCRGAKIIVVDNASTDDTASIAHSKGATVLYESRVGKGHAFKRAMSSVPSRFIIMVDGDLTYQIQSWRKLITPLAAGNSDMTVGSRLEKHQTGAFSLSHYYGNQFLTFIVNKMFGRRFHDTLSGFRGFRTQRLHSIPINAKGFELEIELTIQFCENNLVVHDIPIEYRQRPKLSASKLRTYHDGFIILFAIIRLAKDYKPLTFFGSIGALSIVSASVLLFLQMTLAATLVLQIGTLSLFSGIILNAISQRAKEILQVNRQQYKPDPFHFENEIRPPRTPMQTFFTCNRGLEYSAGSGERKETYKRTSTEASPHT